jgi:hypothetical protein
MRTATSKSVFEGRADRLSLQQHKKGPAVTIRVLVAMNRCRYSTTFHCLDIREFCQNRKRSIEVIATCARFKFSTHNTNGPLDPISSTWRAARIHSEITAKLNLGTDIRESLLIRR